MADEVRLRTLAESSPSIVTPLNPAIGYEEAAKVAKQALAEKKTIRQTVIDRGLIGDKLSEAELDKRLDVLATGQAGRLGKSHLFSAGCDIGRGESQRTLNRSDPGPGDQAGR